MTPASDPGHPLLRIGRVLRVRDVELADRRLRLQLALADPVLERLDPATPGARMDLGRSDDHLGAPALQRPTRTPDAARKPGARPGAFPDEGGFGGQGSRGGREVPARVRQRTRSDGTLATRRRSPLQGAARGVRQRRRVHAVGGRTGADHHRHGREEDHRRGRRRGHDPSNNDTEPETANAERCHRSRSDRSRTPITSTSSA